jgi:prepilin-type N-terminal cleavage/methylation domain-containing protein
MAVKSKRVFGFTLIELMVTVAVVVLLLLLALPSFYSMRQRAALRAAGEESLGLLNEARLEAAKRNQQIKFSVQSNGDDFCLGVTTLVTNTAPCDCLGIEANAALDCDIKTFPSDQDEWRDVTLSGTPTLGEDSGAVILDPKTSAITDADDVGGMTFDGPPGNNSYSQALMIDQFGRGVLCEPSTATSHMSDFTTRQCNL